MLKSSGCSRPTRGRGPEQRRFSRRALVSFLFIGYLALAGSLSSLLASFPHRARPLFLGMESTEARLPWKEVEGNGRT
jgi:hypothetical protein